MKIESNRTHYLRWRLDLGEGDYSIRYHFTWQNNKDFENKYILKHHSKSRYSEITKQMADILIKEHGVSVEEVIGSLGLATEESQTQHIHNKTIISGTTITSLRGDATDVTLNSMEHKFYDITDLPLNQ